MPKNNFFKIFLLALALALMPVLSIAKMSELQNTTLMPVEWQAIRLQESIEGKIIRSLNPIIKESDYIIEVKIDLDLDKAEDPSSKKITKTQQKKKIRFTTSEAPKEGDDFVVFNKLGLEAPIVGEEGVETETSEVELAQKAMIEMNDRFNLFNFLKGIDIKLTFDKGLTKKSRENIKKVIEGLSFNTKDVLPQINIQYLELLDSKVKSDDLKSGLAGAGGAGAGSKDGKSKMELPDQKKTAWDERFKNLDIMIGLIVAAIVLGITAFAIARVGSKHEEKLEAKNENEDDVSAEETSTVDEHGNPVEPTDEILSEEEDMSIDLTKTDPQTTRIVAGLERFRKMKELHYNELVLMMKSWIKAGKGQEAFALKGVVATLNDNELADIFKALSIDERNNWKKCLDSEMTKDDLAKAYTYISGQIIEAMMVPSLIDDYEVCDLLLALKAEDASRFCIDHPELGVVFTNVLSAKTIGEMFAMMPVNITADIIERSSMFHKDQVLAHMPLLKQKLLEMKTKGERPPFLARIFDILPSARPEIEKKLYSTLIQHCAWEDVKETALKILPRELASSLPDTVFKAIIGTMLLEAQVQYFAVQDDDDRATLLDRFAPKGAKNREMVEIEIIALVKNEIALRKLQTDKRESIDADFLALSRTYIGSSVEAQLEMRGEVETWLKEVKAEMKESSTVRRAA